VCKLIAALFVRCLQEMEHRIARAGGHRSDDEARALNARIADLGKLLETVSSEHAMLTSQVRVTSCCVGVSRQQCTSQSAAAVAVAMCRHETSYAA
jgi:hypothetical protein